MMSAEQTACIPDAGATPTERTRVVSALLGPNSRAVLGDGNTMPLVGFGTYQIPNDDAERCTLVALKVCLKPCDHHPPDYRAW